MLLFTQCSEESSSVENPSASIIPAPNLQRLSHAQYGIDVNNKSVFQAHMEENQFLQDILRDHNVNSETIDRIANESIEVFDVRKMRSGRPFTIIKNKEKGVDYFIYEKTDSDYVVFDLTDSVRIYEGHKVIDVKSQTSSFYIETSLHESIQEQQAPLELQQAIEDIFAWTIDFSHLQKGDFLRLIYEEKYVNGFPIGLANVKAAEFAHDGDSYFAFRYGSGDTISYFDINGKPLTGHFPRLPTNRRVRYPFPCDFSFQQII